MYLILDANILFPNIKLLSISERVPHLLAEVSSSRKLIKIIFEKKMFVMIEFYLFNIRSLCLNIIFLPKKVIPLERFTSLGKKIS